VDDLARGNYPATGTLATKSAGEANMKSRFLIAVVAVSLSAGGALAQSGGGGGGAGGASSGGAGASGSTAAPGTATTTPGAPGRSTTTQPGVGIPADSTGTRQRTLTAPADSRSGTLTTPGAPILGSDGGVSGSTGGAATGRGSGASGATVVPPTATECSRGWHSDSRWSQSELSQLCGR
jgi:hypothetical protein